MQPALFRRFTRACLGLALCGPLLAGCDATAPPAPRPEALRLGPIPRAWALDVLPAAGDRPTWIAATSHRDGILGLWAVDAQRQVRLLGTYPEAGFHPDAPRWVDLEADGRPELLVAAEGKNEIQLWHLDDAGKGLRFAEALASASQPLDVLAADLDGDGRTDLVASPYEGPSLTLYWGEGEGRFTTRLLPPQEKGAPPPPRPVPGPRDMAQRPNWGDAPGGGARGPGAPAPGALPQSAEPARRTAIRAPKSIASQARVADWDRDGRPDLLWSDRKKGSILFGKNLGERAFEVRELRPPGEGTPRQVALADLDGDGAPDLVAAMETGGKALILYNDGEGGVRATEEIPAPSWGYSNVTAIGAPDPLLVLTEDPRVILARREGEAWRLRYLPAGELPFDPHLVDVDGDGSLDLLLANSGGEDLSLIFGPLWERAQELTK